MLPHEKALVQRLADQPFALLGINSDGDADDVKKILAERQITWRQAIDVDTGGPLATKWTVNGWPTIYVLDAKGEDKALKRVTAEVKKLCDKFPVYAG